MHETIKKAPALGAFYPHAWGGGSLLSDCLDNFCIATFCFWRNGNLFISGDNPVPTKLS